MPKRLQLHFPTLFAFRQELESNIVCGGAFVETDEPFELRETVEVELDLPFCGQSVVLEAEVVSRVSTDVAGGRAGVAVQFEESVTILRQLLSGMVGVDTPLELSKRREGLDAPVRYQPRSRVRLSAIIEAGAERQTGRTVNLSLSGALIELDGQPWAVGDEIVLTFPHPENRKGLQFSARVVRYQKSAERKNQMGVKFELGSSGPTARLLDLLLKAAHSRMLGRVTGELKVLGVPDLLQMLSASSERGTLLLKRRCLKARVLFEEGALRYVSAGMATGMKALARLLEWSDGEFEFTPTIAVDAPGGAPLPIDMALLEATRHVDELQRLDLSDLPSAGTLTRVRPPGAGDRDKAARAVYDAIRDGMSIVELLNALVECDDEIYQMLATLREQGAIRIT
ncbi:MAG: PilZ domain-containing protein [Myxococcota bacterium]